MREISQSGLQSSTQRLLSSSQNRPHGLRYVQAITGFHLCFWQVTLRFPSIYTLLGAISTRKQKECLRAKQHGFIFPPFTKIRTLAVRSASISKATRMRYRK